MKITYNEILEKMKSAFAEKSGESPKKYSDTELRLEALGTELYALYCYGDYIQKESLPQSANGDYLNMHGKLRDVERKVKSKSTGTLTFSVLSESENDVAIPKGTVCSVSGKPFIQFATADDATIVAGEISVTVNAVSVNCGKENNVPAGTVKIMVNPPASVSSVTNQTDFVGGADDESDESYRERILSSFSVPLNGFNAQSLIAPVMKLDFVTDCNVISDEDDINFYVKTKSGTLSDLEKESIVNASGINTIISKNVVASLATPKQVVALAEVVANDTSGETKASIQNIINSYFDCKIGSIIYKDNIETDILNSGIASNVKVYINGESKPVLASQKDKYYTIQNVEVCFVDKL